MPALGALLAHPHAAKAFRYVAEAPTTTTQRLRSMVTGGPPSFFDVGATFSAGAAAEDSLVHQAAAAGRRLAFMGDATWAALFPTQFNDSHPMPCFNVKDLDSVDDGVWARLPGALAAPGDWDVLVAHFLGADHAGHAHGVRSARMEAKVAQLDGYVGEVAAAMAAGAGPGGPYEDALLLVAGDHGERRGAAVHGARRTPALRRAACAAPLCGGGVGWVGVGVEGEPAASAHLLWLESLEPPLDCAERAFVRRRLCAGQTLGGDHGGGSPEEVDSALVAVDVAALRAALRPEAGAAGAAAAAAAENACRAACTCGAAGNQCAPDLPQADAVPTLAAMLGLPIPYVNLGRLSPELWSMAAGRCAGAGEPVGAALARAAAANSRQVHTYLNTYAAQRGSGFPREVLRSVNRAYAALPPAGEGGGGEGGGAADCGAAAHLAFLDGAAESARQVWTRFRSGWMVGGLALFGLALAGHGAAAWASVGGAAALGGPGGRLAAALAVGPAVQAIGIFSFFYLLSEGAQAGERGGSGRPRRAGRGVEFAFLLQAPPRSPHDAPFALQAEWSVWCWRP
jgi:hypothetical protein